MCSSYSIVVQYIAWLVPLAGNLNGFLGFSISTDCRRCNFFTDVFHIGCTNCNPTTGKEGEKNV